MIICGTGHRPDKLGGYDDKTYNSLMKFAMRKLADFPKIEGVISGMALGWDTALAEAALNLKIPLHVYIPFVGQQGRWPHASQVKYAAILYSATSSKYCSEEGYAVWKMQVRNERMVQDSDTVLALWDGSNGGTGNCVRYANKVGKPVINVWDEWIKNEEG